MTWSRSTMMDIVPSLLTPLRDPRSLQLLLVNFL
jgi:hypothetical protein